MMSRKSGVIKNVSKLIGMVFIAFVLIAFFVSPAFSQGNQFQSITAVEFKDGTIIGGKILEMNADIIKIEKPDGNVEVRKFSDAARFIKEGNASQQGGYSVKGSEVRSFYVGLFGGILIPEDADVDWDYIGIESADVDLDNSWTLGLKFGYILPQANWMAVELEYNYQGDQDFDEYLGTYDLDLNTLGFYNDVAVSVDGDLSSHNLMANLIFRYPEGRIHPYVGGGIGVSFGSLEVKGNVESLGSATLVDDDDTAFAWQLMAGVNFEITPTVSADFTYKYFNSDYEFDADYGLGSLDVDTSNHIMTIGINYHF